MADDSEAAVGPIVDQVLGEPEFREWADDDSRAYLKQEVLARAESLRSRAIRPGAMGQTRSPNLNDARRDLAAAEALLAGTDAADRAKVRRWRLVFWSVPAWLVLGAAGVLALDHTPLGLPTLVSIAIGAIVALLVVGGAYLGTKALESARARRLARAYSELGIASRRDRLRSLERATTEELAEVIRERLREMIAPGKRYATSVRPLHAPGLAELRVHRYLVSTRGTLRLRNLIERMPGGSIGISGPRGAGKTTLLERACDLRLTTEDGDEVDPLLLLGPTGLDALGVKASAPVRFESRDFLLHLTSLVCWAILETASGAREEFRARMTRPDAWSVSALPLRWVGLGLMAVGGLAAALPFIHVSWLRPGTALGLVLFMVGYLLIFVTFQIGRRRYIEQRRLSDELKRETDSEHAGDEALRSDAGRLLERIKFQQTFSSGWSGGLKFPVGIEGKMDVARSVATLQMSLPEVAAELEDLLRRVTARRNVVIGIDELDKMVTRDQAYEFLNEIKVIFGLTGCFFLISVSEEALGSFERRGMPFRDVFDSAFDEIVSVPYLTLDESSRLLSKRVIGLPEQFVALCHCLGGGLPRDVIRSARELATFTVNEESTDTITLSSAARHLVGEEIEARVRGALIALRDVKLEPELSAVLTWVRGMSTEGANTRRLLRRSDAFAASMGCWLAAGEISADQVADQRALLRGIAIEVLTYGYYAATVLQYFNAKLTAKRFKAFDDDRDNHPAELLATARQAFAVSPRIAWDRVSAARRNAGLPERTFPELPTGLPAVVAANGDVRTGVAAY